MIVNIIYSVILPLVGCLVVAFILLFGDRFTPSKHIKEVPDDATWKHILLQPIRECPFWVWIVAILAFVPFITHTIVLWDPTLSWITKISDPIGMFILLIYIILLSIINRRGKLRNWNH